MYLAATWLIIEEHNRLATVLAAPVCPHIGCAGGFLVLFLQDLNCRLVAMNEGCDLSRILSAS
jgi:hypothetical protein